MTTVISIREQLGCEWTATLYSNIERSHLPTSLMRGMKKQRPVGTTGPIGETGEEETGDQGE